MTTTEWNAHIAELEAERASINRMTAREFNLSELAAGRTKARTLCSIEHAIQCAEDNRRYLASREAAAPAEITEPREILDPFAIMLAE